MKSSQILSSLTSEVGKPPLHISPIEIKEDKQEEWSTEGVSRLTTLENKPQPVFIGIRPIKLDLDRPNPFIEHWQQSLFGAMLVALNKNVYEMEGVTFENKDDNYIPQSELTSDDEHEGSGQERPTIYVRDPCVILADQKLILHSLSKKELNYSIVESLNFLSYTKQRVNLFLDGGNCFYSETKKQFLYGFHPHDDISDIKSFKKRLGLYGINFISLKVDVSLGKQLDDYYYHLDCFMQLLPNNRIIILNSKILVPESYEELKTNFGAHNIIDLQFSEYKTSPFMLNFVACGTEPIYNFLCPKMPPEVSSKIKSMSHDETKESENKAQIKCNLFTPQSICSDSLRYGSDEFDIDLATQVVAVLGHRGFYQANVANLTYHVSKNLHGYTTSRGEKLPSDCIQSKEDIIIPENLTAFEEAKYYELSKRDQSLRNAGLSFCPDGGKAQTGGPHCQTLSIPMTLDEEGKPISLASEHKLAEVVAAALPSPKSKKRYSLHYFDQEAKAKMQKVEEKKKTEAKLVNVATSLTTPAG